jgi:hypothetical protein
MNFIMVFVTFRKTWDFKMYLKDDYLERPWASPSFMVFYLWGRTMTNHLSKQKDTDCFVSVFFMAQRQYTLSISDSFDVIRLSVSQLFYICSILGDISQFILGGFFGIFNEDLTLLGKFFHIKIFIMIISWAQIMYIYYPTSIVQLGFFMTIP